MEGKPLVLRPGEHFIAGGYAIQLPKKARRAVTLGVWCVLEGDAASVDPDLVPWFSFDENGIQHLTSKPF